MLAIDFVGLFISIAVIGPRYLVYGILASLVHEIGGAAMVLFFRGNIEGIITAGIFGKTVFSGIQPGTETLLVILGGSLLNIIMWGLVGGKKEILNIAVFSPFALVQTPFAVANLRLGLWAAIYGIWQLWV